MTVDNRRRVKQMTHREVIKHKRDHEFSFEKLLEPYRDGGVQGSKVTRTMGTIIDYLLNKKKYPSEVVGAALMKVFLELYAGRVFKGDGTYGSPGRELLTHLRITCDEFNHTLQQRDMYKWMSENVFKAVALWAAQETERQLRPCWRRWFTKKPPLNVEGFKDVSS